MLLAVTDAVIKAHGRSLQHSSFCVKKEAQASNTVFTLRHTPNGAAIGKEWIIWQYFSPEVQVTSDLIPA